MKKSIFIVFTIIFAVALVAAIQYNADGLFKFKFANIEDDGGSIQILADLETLTLSTDYGSVGNSGKIGYIVYNADGSVAERSEALFYKQLELHNDIVVRELTAGQSVGFFLERNNGGIEEDFIIFEREDDVYVQFPKNGKFSGNSEAFVIFGVLATEPPQGQPLPRRRRGKKSSGNAPRL